MAKKSFLPTLLLIILFYFTFLSSSAQAGDPSNIKVNPILIINIIEKDDELSTPHKPFVVKFDRKNRILVADQFKSGIFVYDFKGDLIRIVGKFGEGDGEFKGPAGGVDTDINNNIYASDPYNHRIQVFDEAGNFLYKFGQAGNEPNKFSEPRGMCIGANSRIYIADTTQANIKIFEKDGNFVKAFGQEREFYKPKTVTAKKNGKVFVVQRGEPLINIFDSEGNFLSAFAKRGHEEKNINDDIDGIALDGLGNIFVSDKDVGKIKVYNKKGEFSFSIGGLGSRPGEFLSPRGIDIDDSGEKIAVADSWNSRVQIFSLDDIFKKEE